MFPVAVVLHGCSTDIATTRHHASAKHQYLIGLKLQVQQPSDRETSQFKEYDSHYEKSHDQVHARYKIRVYNVSTLLLSVCWPVH
jgi:hypothetical protein